jgi:hypothetical protein
MRAIRRVPQVDETVAHARERPGIDRGAVETNFTANAAHALKP